MTAESLIDFSIRLSLDASSAAIAKTADLVAGRATLAFCDAVNKLARNPGNGRSQQKVRDAFGNAPIYWQCYASKLARSMGIAEEVAALVGELPSDDESLLSGLKYPDPMF
jgi:hypothetical protein